MTSVRKSRYAVWHHPSQVMNGSVAWRQTPKSKNFIAVVAPAVVPGAVKVIEANATSIKVKLDKDQCETIERWVTGNLPDYVLPPTVCETQLLHHSGTYNAFQSPSMKYIESWPLPEHLTMIRVVPEIQKLGPVYKTHLTVTDVLFNDITQA